jgi:hypothetical protein
MNRRDKALTVGGVVIGSTLLARRLRSRRAIEFAGRVALITGGSRGLGLLIARELGRLGARVIIESR